MGKIVVNDKEVTKEEALEMLKDDSVIVKALTYTASPGEKRTDPPTMEGFSIGKDVVSSMARTMEGTNAGYCRIKIDNSGKIGNRSMLIIMYDTNNRTRFQRMLLKLVEKFI